MRRVGWASYHAALGYRQNRTRTRVPWENPMRLGIPRRSVCKLGIATITQDPYLAAYLRAWVHAWVHAQLVALLERSIAYESATRTVDARARTNGALAQSAPCSARRWRGEQPRGME
jgi:hypothetical protein